MKEAKIEEITRPGSGNKPRPVLLKRNDAQAQMTVLSKAKLFRNARIEMRRDIYIVPDKTVEERKIYREYIEYTKGTER